MSLLRAVLAAPDDEALRLVYADALLEAGDPRGELIAIETRLAHGFAPALWQRRRELRRAHGAAWWPGLPVRRIRTVGGLVDAIAATPAELTAVEALAAREPLRSLEIQGPLDEAAARGLPTVRHLIARPLAAGALAAILEHGNDLESLDVDGAQDIELGDALPRCRHLALGDGVALPRLQGWAHLAQLASLDVSQSFLEAYQLADVLAQASGLEVLRISGNALSDAEIAEIARGLAGAPRLARLEAIGCDISSYGLRRLREALPDLEIVTELGARPQRLDLLGCVIEFLPDGDEWYTTLDGQRWPLELRYDFSTSLSLAYPKLQNPNADGRLAQVAEGIAQGARRELTATGATITARFSPRDNDFYIVITVPDDDRPIEIVIDHYID